MLSFLFLSWILVVLILLIGWFSKPIYTLLLLISVNLVIAVFLWWLNLEFFSFIIILVLVGALAVYFLITVISYFSDLILDYTDIATKKIRENFIGRVIFSAMLKTILVWSIIIFPLYFGFKIFEGIKEILVHDMQFSSIYYAPYTAGLITFFSNFRGDMAILARLIYLEHWIVTILALFILLLTLIGVSYFFTRGLKISGARRNINWFCIVKAMGACSFILIILGIESFLVAVYGDSSFINTGSLGFILSCVLPPMSIVEPVVKIKCTRKFKEKIKCEVLPVPCYLFSEALVHDMQFSSTYYAPYTAGLITFSSNFGDGDMAILARLIYLEHWIVTILALHWIVTILALFILLLTLISILYFFIRGLKIRGARRNMNWFRIVKAMGACSFILIILGIESFLVAVYGDSSFINTGSLGFILSCVLPPMSIVEPVVKIKCTRKFKEKIKCEVLPVPCYLFSEALLRELLPGRKRKRVRVSDVEFNLIRVTLLILATLADIQWLIFDCSEKVVTYACFKRKFEYFLILCYFQAPWKFVELGFTPEELTSIGCRLTYIQINKLCRWFISRYGVLDL